MEAKKKKMVYPGTLATPYDRDEDLNPRGKTVYSEGQKRRAHQVGRVLYDNIVQLVNSGQLSDAIATYAVEIVKVKVVPDFSAVNVYWLSTGTQEDASLEALLKQHEGRLRHLLTSYHVLGHIPRINFVRDDSRSHYMKVEQLLSKADFGPDFVPTRLDTAIRDDIMLQRGRDSDKLSPETKLQEEFVKLNLDNELQGNRQLSTSPDNFLSSQSDIKPESGGITVSHEFRPNLSGHVPQPEKAPINPLACAVTGTINSTNSYMHKAVKSPDKTESSLSHPSKPHQDVTSGTFVPCSLEVGDLGKQVLGESLSPIVHATSGTVNTAGNMHKEVNRASASDKNFTPPFEGFRDDLYGIPHSELVNKVLACKNKVRARPAVFEPKYTLNSVGAAVEANALKSSLAKMSKRKSRDGSLSNYQTTLVLDHHKRSAERAFEDAPEDDLDDDEDEMLDLDDDQFPQK